MSTDLLIPFFLAGIVFAVMPGPAMLYTAARTLAGGRTAGFMAALGIHVGGYVHVVAAAAGLFALFQAVPAAYAVVKIAGAFYLIWLGFCLFRTPTGGGGPQPKAHSPTRAFTQSVLVEVLNPKAALFYLAFLPQFIDTSGTWPVWLQFLVLGTITNLMFSAADLVSVVMASALVERLKHSFRAQRIVRGVGGTILMGLGLKLAMERS